MNSHKFWLRACDGGRRGSVWHESSCQWRVTSWEKITVKVVLLKLKGNKGLHVTKTYSFFFFFPFSKSSTKSDTAPVLTAALTVSPQKGRKEEEKALNRLDASSIHFLFPPAWSFMKSAAFQDSLLFLYTATAWKPSLFFSSFSYASVFIDWNIKANLVKESRMRRLWRRVGVLA